MGVLESYESELGSPADPRGLHAGALERFVSDRRERAELLSAVAAACEASAEVRAAEAGS